MDSALQGFDPSDRKFLAVALAHPEKPPILNAVDSDWLKYTKAIEKYSVTLRNLCSGG